MEDSNSPSQAVQTEDRAAMPMSGEDTSAGIDARNSGETAEITNQNHNGENEQKPATSGNETLEKDTASDRETAGKSATSDSESSSSSDSETDGKSKTSCSEVDGKSATAKSETEEKSATMSNETAEKPKVSGDETDVKSATMSNETAEKPKVSGDETDVKSGARSSDDTGNSVASKNEAEGIPATSNNETDATTRCSNPEGETAVGIKTEGKPGESEQQAARESGSAQDAASEVELSGSEISGDSHQPAVFIYSPPKLQPQVVNRHGNPHVHGNAHAGGGGFKLRTASKPASFTATTSGGHQLRSNPTAVRPERGGKAREGDEASAHAASLRPAASEQQQRHQSQQQLRQERQAMASSSEKPTPSTAAGIGGGRRGDGGSARGRRESDDDTNIYKRELQAVKIELQHLKESVEDSGKLKVRRSTSARSSKLRHPLADFNASGSYCDTQFIDFYMKKDSTNRYYPVSKRTTTTLVDPWDELAMQKPTERVKRNVADRGQAEKRQRQSAGRSGHESRAEDSSRSPHGATSSGGAGAGSAPAASSRATPLPIMDFSATAEYWRRPVSFVELPKIRARFRELHTASGLRRRQLDYARASEECHSLQLDSFERVRSRRSRRSLARSCSAYLAATPGSRAAVGDCLERSRCLWYDPAIEDEDEMEKQHGETERRKINFSSHGRRSAKAQA